MENQIYFIFNKGLYNFHTMDFQIFSSYIVELLITTTLRLSYLGPVYMIPLSRDGM